MGEAMRRLVVTSDDAQEGRRAATEGHPPHWSGR